MENQSFVGKKQFPNLLSRSIPKGACKLRLNLDYNSKPVSPLTTPKGLKSSEIFTPKSSMFTSKSRQVSIHSGGFFNIKSFEGSEILKFPTTSADVINTVKDLPKWVRTELLGFEKVYFYSKLEKTAQRSTDEKGDYIIITGDDVNYQYEIIENLGKGTFGQVVKVFDHKAKQFFAMKIIRNRRNYSEQAKTEIELLNYAKLLDSQHKNNIVHIHETFIFRQHTVNTI